MATATDSSASALANALGTGDLKTHLGEFGGYRQIIQAFIKYVGAVGVPPLLVANPNVPEAVTTAANQALTALGTDFKAAQVTATGLQEQVDGITAVAVAAGAFAQHGAHTMTSILSAIVAYKKDNESVDRPELTHQIQTMVDACTRLQGQVAAARTDTGTAVSALLQHEAALNSDFLALQQAIPPANGQELNLDTLTEQQAYQQLSDQVTSLNEQIGALKKDILNLTIGESVLGGLGGFLAVIMCWNAIGWPIGGGVAGGVVVMEEEKLADVKRINKDLEDIALTEDEQGILHPLYTIKNATSQLGDCVTAAQNVGTSLEALKDGFATAAGDLETFLSDVTNDVSLEDLQTYAAYVQDDYGTLDQISTTLIAPLPSHQLPLSAMVNAQPAASA